MEGEIWIEGWKERMDGMAGMSSAGNVCLGWKRRKKSLLRDGAYWVTPTWPRFFALTRPSNKSG